MVPMSSNSRVVATSSFAPVARMEWETNIAPVGVEDPMDQAKFVLIYNNLMYDLVGAALAKLGVEYSKLITGEYDGKQFDAEMTKVLDTLNAGTVSEEG